MHRVEQIRSRNTYVQSALTWANLATKEVQIACAFFLRRYIGVRLLNKNLHMWISSLRTLLLSSSWWSGQSSFPSGGKTQFSASHNLSWPSSTAAGTLLSSQSGLESDNTRTTTNSDTAIQQTITKGRRKPTTIGINAVAQAWYLNWQGQRREILCNIWRVRTTGIQVKTYTSAHVRLV